MVLQPGTKTAGPLDIGLCEVVSCTWDAPPHAASGATDVLVKPNDANDVAQCNTDNDQRLVMNVFCPGRSKTHGIRLPRRVEVKKAPT